VFSKYGHVENTFASNQLLYDEYLTAICISQKNEYLQGNCTPRQIGINYSMQMQKS
jgi:hypothetical protein